MAEPNRQQQLSIADSERPRYVLSERGSISMADDVVMEVLKGIQASIVALDRKVTRQHAMVTQDIRMIRSTIHDMGKTRVTEGEIVALHEDVNRMQHGLDVLTTRVELLEGHRE